jgi:drug/metabolite transporter (DMT)-like permease
LTGAALALGSAVCFGVADYAGGLLSRRANAGAIALAVQVSGTAVMVVVAPMVPAPGLGLYDIGWGALSGVGTAVGVMFLYRGLTRGDMSVVVPVSTAGSVVLPVLVGLTLLGERPSALSWLGIAVAVPAIGLISGANRRTGSADGAAVLDGLISSVGFALQYIALAQAGAAAGLWPVTAGRLASVLTMLVLVGVTATRLKMQRRLAVPAVANGVVAASGLVLYMLATRQEMMAVAVVLSSLYPIIPVLLGIALLGERPTPGQTAGLIGAGATIALLVAG